MPVNELVATGINADNVIWDADIAGVGRKEGPEGVAARSPTSEATSALGVDWGVVLLEVVVKGGLVCLRELFAL